MILFCLGKETGRNSEVKKNFAGIAFTFLRKQEERLMAEVGGLRLGV